VLRLTSLLCAERAPALALQLEPESPGGAAASFLFPATSEKALKCGNNGIRVCSGGSLFYLQTLANPWLHSERDTHEKDKGWAPVRSLAEENQRAESVSLGSSINTHSESWASHHLSGPWNA
jgi:hypothetical protein